MRQGVLGARGNFGPTKKNYLPPLITSIPTLKVGWTYGALRVQCGGDFGPPNFFLLATTQYWASAVGGQKVFWPPFFYLPPLNILIQILKVGETRGTGGRGHFGPTQKNLFATTQYFNSNSESRSGIGH